MADVMKGMEDDLSIIEDKQAKTPTRAKASTKRRSSGSSTR
jgi:hypothetical protein